MLAVIPYYYKGQNFIKTNIANKKTSDNFNNKSHKNITFTGRVPSSIKLSKDQYALSNALTKYESLIVNNLYQGLPSINQVNIGILNCQNKKIKELSALKNAFYEGNLLLPTPFDEDIKSLLNQDEINFIPDLNKNLEETLFNIDPLSTTCQSEIFQAFNKTNKDELDENALIAIELSKSHDLKNKELTILDEIISKPFENLSPEAIIYSKALEEIFSNFSSTSSNMTLKEKAQIMKLINLLNIDGACLLKDYKQQYNDLLQSAKNKKELLAYADEKTWTDKDVENYFNQNQAKILKTIIIADSSTLNAQLDHKIDKFDRTIGIINELNNTEAINLIHQVIQKIKEPENKIRIIELLKSYSDDNRQNEFMDELKKINQDNKININSINSIAQKYMQIFAKNDDINGKNFELKYAHTLSAMLDRLNVLNMPNYREYLMELLSTISNSYSKYKQNYSDFLLNPQSEIGKANLDTKKQFLENGLNFDTWLNYDAIKEFSTNEDKDKIQIRLWDRNVGFDLFQGNYTGICIASNGKNCFGAVDSLINSAVQIVELSTKDKVIGNVFTYWAKDKDDDSLCFVIDGITLDKKFLENEDLKENLIDFMKEYAKNTAPDKDYKIYVGDYYNGLSFDECKSKKMSAKILGNTGDRKYYLDSMAKDKYVKIDGNIAHRIDVKRIYPI